MMETAPGTTAVGRPGMARALWRLLSCIRLDEVLVLQGSPLIGAVLSMGRLTAEKAAALSLLGAGSCCLVAYVFVLNDWSGADTDLKDPNRATGAFLTKGVGRTEIGYLWMALLATSLLLLCPFGPTTLIIALAIAGLGALYSAPAPHMKGVPLLGSALHLVGGLLHFLLGYSLFGAIDGRGLEIGCFFGLTFAAGHLTHEARDYDADLRNGIRTNAVMFGRTHGFVAGLVLFTFAYVLLVVLAARGIVPRALILVAGLYALHLHWSLQTLRAGLGFESIRRLQLRYRWLYAAIGLMLLVTALLAY